MYLRKKNKKTDHLSIFYYSTPKVTSVLQMKQEILILKSCRVEVFCKELVRKLSEQSFSCNRVLLKSQICYRTLQSPTFLKTTQPLRLPYEFCKVFFSLSQLIFYRTPENNWFWTKTWKKKLSTSLRKTN